MLDWIKQDFRRVTFTWQLGEGITKTKRMGGLPWEAPEVPDNALREGDMTDQVIAVLSERQGAEEPFFLAVGYHKPHLPFVAPKRYFDLYRRDKLPLAANTEPPRDVPECAMYNWNDLRHYYGIPKVGPLSEEQSRDLVHAYYACVSYVDAQIGRLLDELGRLRLADNTVIVLWGDHGWQLGEHGMWDKHSNFETSTHAPLLVSVPGQKPGRTRALVEFRRHLPIAVRIVRPASAHGAGGHELCTVAGRAEAQVEAGRVQPVPPRRARLRPRHGPFDSHGPLPLYGVARGGYGLLGARTIRPSKRPGRERQPGRRARAERGGDATVGPACGPAGGGRCPRSSGAAARWGADRPVPADGP